MAQAARIERHELHPAGWEVLGIAGVHQLAGERAHAAFTIGLADLGRDVGELAIALGQRVHHSLHSHARALGVAALHTMQLLSELHDIEGVTLGGCGERIANVEHARVHHAPLGVRPKREVRAAVHRQWLDEVLDHFGRHQ